MLVKASDLKAGDQIDVPVDFGTRITRVAVHSTESDRYETTVYYTGQSAAVVAAIIFDREELVEIHSVLA